MAELLELARERLEIVDLAVTNTRYVACFRKERLMSVSHVDDAQTAHRQRAVVIIERAAVIGTAMTKLLCDCPNDYGSVRKNPDGAGDAAHGRF